VVADVVEALLLWPLAVLGCYLTIRAWRGSGAFRAALVALCSSLIFGLLSRPAYAVGSLLNSSDVQSRQWLVEFIQHSNSLYPWVSNTVEYGVLYSSCTAVMLGYFSFVSLVKERRLRNGLEVEVGRARQRALRSQLNPHFLFNSLNSIVSSSDERPATQLLVTQLSDLLRRTLRASEQEEHELFEELTYVEEYLEIEQTRQPSRVDWRMNVEAGCARAAVPSLLLLPLVENSVTHGLRGGVRTVVIDINVWRTGGELFIQIGNTCCSSVPPRDPARQGLGLRNVTARLDMLFGREASFRADRADPGRFEVQMSLPLREVSHADSDC
jgi:LytS/YehU family sensor histidine kinase